MKKHDFYLNLVDKKGRESLFREITNIKEFISMKLTMMELLFSQWDGSIIDVKSCSMPYLHIDDYNLHRAFIVSNNKIFSFGIGFTIQTFENHIEAFRLKQKKITAKHIAEAQAILKLCDDKTLYKDIDDDDLEQAPSQESKMLFEYLLFEEPAYIRYDYDKQTKSEVMHPKHHLDVNFSPLYSYKIGLPRGIKETEYIRVLDKTEFRRKLNLNMISNRFQKGNYHRNNLKKWKKKHN